MVTERMRSEIKIYLKATVFEQVEAGESHTKDVGDMEAPGSHKGKRGIEGHGKDAGDEEGEAKNHLEATVFEQVEGVRIMERMR
jgi:hypothetical protein